MKPSERMMWRRRATRGGASAKEVTPLSSVVVHNEASAGSDSPRSERWASSRSKASGGGGADV